MYKRRRETMDGKFDLFVCFCRLKFLFVTKQKQNRNKIEAPSLPQAQQPLQKWKNGTIGWEAGAHAHIKHGRPGVHIYSTHRGS